MTISFHRVWLFVFMFFLTPIASAQESPKPTVKEPAVTKIEKHSIKAFRCTLADPYEVQNTVHTLLGNASTGLGFQGIGFAGFGGLGNLGQNPPMANTFSGGGPMGGMGNMGGNGVIGGFAGIPNYWRTIVDPRTEVLLVRGTEKELQVATEFVSVVETPAERPVPELKTMHVYRLKHADPKALVETLNTQPLGGLQWAGNDIVAIEQQVRVAAYTPFKMLVATGTEDALKKMDEVVKAVDIPTIDKKQSAITTKVFRLQHCIPEEVKEALEQLLQNDGQVPPVALLSGMGLVDDNPLRISVDNRTRSVIVRSTMGDVQLASEFIAIIETPSGKPLLKTEKLTALELKHGDANQLATLVGELELSIRVVGLPLAKLIVAHGSAEQIKSFVNIVKELDVPTAETKTEPKRLIRE